MINKISISQLKIGMQVIDAGLSDTESPHIYSAETLIERQEQMENMVNAGYSEVFIDTDKGFYFKENPQKNESPSDFYRSVLVDKLSRRERPRFDALGCHAPQNERLYTETLDRVKNIAEYIEKKQRIPLDEAKIVIDGIVESVTNNLDSLAFISKLKQYDNYTYTHGLNVTIFSVAFALYLGLGEANIAALGYAGLFHDVGKSRIPLEILNKPDKLTPAEFETMKLHPVYGYQIVSQSPEISQEVRRACLEHHEKFAGGGYPNNYSQAQISKAAALISLVDVFDALTSNRPYKTAMHSHKALCMIYTMRNSAFMPVLTEKFVKFIGIYPIGSILAFRGGFKGIVIEQNNENLLRPHARIILDKQNKYCKVRDICLTSEPYAQDPEYDIVECLGAEACRIDVSQYLSQGDGSPPT